MSEKPPEFSASVLMPDGDGCDHVVISGTEAAVARACRLIAAHVVAGSLEDACTGLSGGREQAVKLMLVAKGLDLLRNDSEGDSVTVNCSNPDGPPNEAITVNAAWTGWQDRRFEGATLFEAVDAAVTAMLASRQ